MIDGASTVIDFAIVQTDDTIGAIYIEPVALIVKRVKRKEFESSLVASSPVHQKSWPTSTNAECRTKSHHGQTRQSSPPSRKANSSQAKTFAETGLTRNGLGTVFVFFFSFPQRCLTVGTRCVRLGER